MVVTLGKRTPVVAAHHHKAKRHSGKRHKARGKKRARKP